MMSMTFHESFGELPTKLLRAYKRYNVSPSDHTRMLAAFNKTNDSIDVPWPAMLELVNTHSAAGYLRLPLYL